MKRKNTSKKVIRIPIILAITIISSITILLNKEKVEVKIQGLAEMKANYSTTETNTYDISKAQNGSVIATLSEDGVLTISGRGNMTDWFPSSSVPWYSVREQIKQVKIEDGITNIGMNTFADCNSLESITIPDSVTRIGTDAFFYCSSLESIIIPNSVRSIDTSAFNHCSSLKSVTIPESVTSIGSYAFFCCSSLENITIPDSVIWIGEFAFNSCSGLKSITIPESVTSIGSNAFNSCRVTKLIAVGNNIVELPHIIKRAQDEEDILYSSTGFTLTNCTIDNEQVIINDGKTYATIHVKEGSLKNLTYVIACNEWDVSEAEDGSIKATLSEDGVLTISGTGEMKNWKGSSNPPWDSIDQYIKQVKIEKEVTNIGFEAFKGCIALKRITIPDSVTSIGHRAFAYCYSLKSITIPENVTSIENDVFSNCSNLTIYCKSNSTAETYAKDNNIPYVIDDEAPTAPIYNAVYVADTSKLYTSGEWTNELVQLILSTTETISGIRTIQYKKNGGEWTDFEFVTNGEITQSETTYTGISKMTLTDRRNDTFYYRAVDNLGNISATSGPFTIKYDTTAPAAPTITNSSGGNWTNKEVTLTMYSDDVASGIEKIEYSYDKITWINDWAAPTIEGVRATVSGKWHTERNETLYARAIDKAGNISEISSTQLKIDATEPTAGSLTMKLKDETGADYSNNTWTNQNVYIEATNGTDTLSGHKSTTYSVNGGEETTASQTLTESGIYEIVVTTTDNAGNTATNSYTIKIRRAESISVTTNPEKVTYDAYENFNAKGIIVSIKYDTGDIEETSNYTVINGENLTCKVNKIEIQYNDNPGIKTELPINVGHAEVIDTKVEPTCTETGLTEGMHCEVCNTVLIKQEEIPALGHNFTNYTSNNDGTCTEDGTQTAKCDRCSETETIVDEGSKLGHNYESKVTAPTCTEKGYTTHTCTKCQDSYADTYTNALGHGFTNYVSNNDATCTEDGTKTAKCDRCDETDTKVDEVSKLGHNFTDYKSNNDATCTEDGTKTAKCDRCDEKDTKADEGTKLGHNFTNYKSNNDATCTEDGTKTAKCDRCDEKDTKADEGTKLDHNFTNYISNNDATCAEDGTQTAKCETCDETDTKIDEGSKVAHNYENGKCAVCGEEEPKLKITSEEYEIEAPYISNIKPKTTIKELKEKIETNGEIKIFKGTKEIVDENAKVETGMTIKVTLNDEEVEYTLVVIGDCNGTGTTSVSDLTSLMMSRAESMSSKKDESKILKGAYAKAVDMDGNGKIGISDITLLCMYIVSNK